ncbi:RNA pseudouridylate synthase domain-containing protein 1-like [Glandiceps talaboti]
METEATLDDISVLYKSENYVIVNKHYDVMINHQDPNHDVTVSNQLKRLHPELADTTVVHDFRFVHQLDYSTSGVLCLALNKSACAVATKLFQERLVHKEYVALVRGHIDKDFIEVEKEVAENLEDGCSHMMCVPNESSQLYSNKKSALTHLQVQHRGRYDGKPATKVLLFPKTGRRHQLRVHCSSIGHTIIGDYTYSLRQDTEPYRMMLHAHRIIIPIPNEHIDVTAPDPFMPEIDPKWQPLAAS